MARQDLKESVLICRGCPSLSGSMNIDVVTLALPAVG